MVVFARFPITAVAFNNLVVSPNILAADKFEKGVSGVCKRKPYQLCESLLESSDIPCSIGEEYISSSTFHPGGMVEGLRPKACVRFRFLLFLVSLAADTGSFLFSPLSEKTTLHC